jgi:hypothetical protein
MFKRATFWAGFAGVALALFGASPSQAVSMVSADYRLPARQDPDIASEAKTEIWATLWRPEPLAAGPHPLILFLHGNHATCGRVDQAMGIRVDDRNDYTLTGRCPSGYIVAPSHRGYAYLAEKLAAAGYIVVSINANRGVNAADGVSGDDGLNLRRGRLVLKHLQLLAQWNRSGGAPSSLGFDLKGKLDLSEIGLVGHSRGGEGMRAALAQYTDAGSPWRTRIGPLGLKALFEIAPVDGQTSRTLDARGIAWNVLLPYCDGDVSDLEGVKPFDRMLRTRTEHPPLPKSTFAVYGANHNFYNTEWQLSDSEGCAGAGNLPLFGASGGSFRERQTARLSLVPFMLAHVGKAAQPTLANLFDPRAPLPSALTGVTKVDRGFSVASDPTMVAVIEGFNRSPGTSSSGQAALVQGIGLQHVHPEEHDATQRAAAITWSGTGSHLFQTNWTAPGTGRSLAGFTILELRVSRQCDGSCWTLDPPTSATPTDFSVQLVRPNGSLSRKVALSSYVSLRGPVGRDEGGGLASLHPILMTARIPVPDFGLAPADAIRGVRFSFDRTPSGAIQLADIRLSRRSAASAAAAALLVADAAPLESPAEAPASLARSATASAAPTARIVAIRPAASAASLKARAAATPGPVEVEIAADRPLPVTDSLPTLTIGDQQVRQSCFAVAGQTDRIVFTVCADQFARLPEGAPAELRVGATRRMVLGPLAKAARP